MAPRRDNQFKMLLSDEELEMLRELAEHSGLTASDYLRVAIRTQYATTVTQAVKAIAAERLDRLSKSTRRRKPR